MQFNNIYINSFKNNPKYTLNLGKIFFDVSLVCFLQLLIVSNVDAQVLSSPHKLESEHQCLALTTEHPSYFNAVKRVFLLEELVHWQKNLGSDEKASHVPAMDKTEIINHECFWSIGIYINRKDSLLLWKTFFVGVGSSKIFSEPQ